MSTVMQDMYWTAGFLDGEGSFTLAGGKPAKTPRLQATQVDIGPLEKLQRLFGGGEIRPKRLTKISRQTCYDWVLTGPRAVAVMMTIYPLMSQKRQAQIRRVLNVWRNTPTNFGEGYHSSVLNDTEALAAMQRVHDGEGVVEVAKSVGISHSVLSLWMHGKNKAYLRQQLVGEGIYTPAPRTPEVPDEEALAYMRLIQQGAMSMARAARLLGINHVTVQYWMSGKRKPHLLAQLQREAQG